MKYYIPTSSLNFNNILSTESISPKSFYEKRGFGYSWWFTVDENSKDNVILLYAEPHEFKRPQSDIEDHPMLVEIEADVDFKPTPLKDGVYYYEQTIYLNPWQTRFIFFSEKVQMKVFSMSESSIETKMVRLYKNRMVVENYKGKFLKIDDTTIPTFIENEKFIERDYNINKMKGLLYGYYIGANLSILPDQVEKLNKLREMRDIFSSVVSSNDRNLSDFQSKRLKELYLFLSEKDPAYDELAKVSLSNKEKKEVFAIIKGRIEYFMERIKRLDIFGLKSKVNPNPTINWVECEIEKVKSEIEKCKLLSPEDGEVIVSEFKMISQKAENGQELSALYIAWVNDVLISRQYNGKISSIKMQLSDQITEKASDIIGDQWKESKIRNYLNDLRRHIGGYEFNHEWNNGLLSSMAAVLIKGDVWDSLLHFMQSKEMNDYRIAFSLYGELNGFANLPRDFTDILLEQKREYVAEVYNEFYGQLFDKRISNKDIDNDVTESKIETQTNDVTSPHRDNIKGDKNKWQDEILNYAELKIKKNKKLLLKSLNEALGKSKDIQELFDILPQYEGWKSGKKKENDDFKNLKAYFLDDKIVHTDSIENKNNSVKQLELFDDNQSPIQQEKKVEIIKDENTSTVVNDNSYDSILSNESWIDLCIKSFIPISDEDVKKQFKKDAIWFINNHKEVYYDSKGEKHQGCYHDRDKSNHQVIKRFKDFLDKRKNPVKQKTQWLGLIYKTIPIDEIINYLSSKYGDGKSTN